MLRWRFYKNIRVGKSSHSACEVINTIQMLSLPAMLFVWRYAVAYVGSFKAALCDAAGL